MTLAAKTVPLYFIHLINTPIEKQLQLEEALLRADQRNWCLINYGSSPAIVMGISGKPELLINQSVLQENPVPVIKRFSGGGTVFIDPSTFFITWICNTSDSQISCNPSKIHEWAAEIYKKTFPQLNMRLLENDYIIDDKKFGGNAQYLSRGRWLHHSSFLWDYHSENMRYLQIPAKMPNYRQKRSHQDFLCRLKNYFIDFSELRQHVIDHLDDQFNLMHVCFEEWNSIRNLPHRKGTTLIA